MSRIRTLKPDFFRSRSLARCSMPARLTFAGLWCEADDHGRGIADCRLIAAAVWPLDDEIGAEEVAAHLDELATTGHIVLYTVEGEQFYVVVKWEKHQAAAYRRGEAQHPAPPAETPSEQSSHADACKKVQGAHESVLEGKGEEGRGEEGSASQVVAHPTSPVVAAAPLEARFSAPRNFVEIVDPGGPVAIRAETQAILDEAHRLATEAPLTPTERNKLRPVVTEALAAGYTPPDLAQAIASTPFRTRDGVMGELRKRKQPQRATRHEQNRNQILTELGGTA